MAMPYARTAALAMLLASTACVGTVKRPSYDGYVWPPPPDAPRIKLEDIVYGRMDVLAKTSGLQRALLGASPTGPYDWLRKPFAAAFDAQGRLLVTDTAAGALYRFDRTRRRAEVIGTRGALPLRNPMGIGLGPDGTIFVADIGLRKVVAFDRAGKVKTVFGRAGELVNPTDAALSPDGQRLYVADSKAHRIVVFDAATAKRVTAFGSRGEGEGAFAFPTSLAFDQEGNLLVVDQINTRIQILTEEGEFVDRFGSIGVSFANFVRPKDVAVDDVGFIYVSDAAFGNVQIFDADLRLLTFVGTSGTEPGQFRIASGVAVQGDRIAVVDQLGRRVQIFRFIVDKRG